MRHPMDSGYDRYEQGKRDGAAEQRAKDAQGTSMSTTIWVQSIHSPNGPLWEVVQDPFPRIAKDEGRWVVWSEDRKFYYVLPKREYHAVQREDRT